jgi:hypothetical protein
MSIIEKITTTVLTLTLALLTGCSEEQKTMQPLGTDKQQSTKCALDVVNGDKRAVVYANSDRVDFRGWAADSISTTALQKLYLVLTNRTGKNFTFAVTTRSDRPDVAKVYGHDDFLKSGFRLVANISTLPKGTYGITLQIPNRRGLTICTTKRALVITK